MTCDECKEQVFELIEREAVDPEGVQAILARCPDCRAAFDEMKAALAMVERLPIEEPGADVDAAILRAAAARAPRVVPLRRWRLRAPPWAVAAIALLAVGVGVWTIPRAVQLEGDAAPVEMKNAAEVIVAEPAPPKRVAELPADEPRAVRMAQAPESRPMEAMAAGAVTESALAEVESSKSRARKKERGDDADDAICKRRLDEIERLERADHDYVPKPEEQLAIGKCYGTLDDVAKARKWLQRAAKHRETKARAEAALRRLAPK